MNTIKNVSRNLELTARHFNNELKRVFRDKGALLILIGAMIVYPIIYSIGYFNETLTDLSVGVVDLDHSSASRKYTKMVDASSELAVSCKPNSLKEAETLFMANEISGVILIPKGFQQEVFSGKQAHVAVYADASYFLKYKNEILSLSYVNAYFNGGIAVKRYMSEGKSLQQAKVCIKPLSVKPYILYNPASAYGSFIMPGLILVVIQQTLLIGIGLMGGSFSESKDTPFLLPLSERRKEIIPYLLGKAGAYLFISLVNISIAVVFVHKGFHYPDKANIVHVFMLLLPYLLSVIFLGIGISTWFSHRESAIVFMVFLSPIALFLSGLSWPVSAMPSWLVALSKLMPSSTVVPAYLRLRTMGVGITEVANEVLILYGQLAVYALLTFIFFIVKVNIKQQKVLKF